MARAATKDRIESSMATPSREDFAAMLEQSFETQSPQEGQVIKGTIVAIENDFAMVDVGLKTEGRISLKEFAMPGVPADIKVGDTVEVYLERVENALGEAVLSRDKARREESWGKLEKAFQNNEKVHGVIFNQVKGGFTVDLDGAVAFLPRSQVDIRPIRDVSPLMNNQQPFQILKMDRRRGNIVVSRRTVLEETRAEQRQELVQNLEEGQVIDGAVKNITDYGAFVDLGGIDGLIHNSELSYARIKHPSEVVKIGDTVSVEIMKFDPEARKVSLSLKHALPDPWDEHADKLFETNKLTAQIVKVTPNYLLVEIVPGVLAMVPKGEFDPNAQYSPGQEVEVTLLTINNATRRITASIQHVADVPLEEVEKYVLPEDAPALGVIGDSVAAPEPEAETETPTAE